MHLDLDIHNFYEHLVVEYLNSTSAYADYDVDYISDICCLALSRLPARYIRHEIDMAFFLSSQQRSEMTQEVRDAVEESHKYLLNKSKLIESVQ